MLICVVITLAALGWLGAGLFVGSRLGRMAKD